MRVRKRFHRTPTSTRYFLVGKSRWFAARIVRKFLVDTTKGLVISTFHRPRKYGPWVPTGESYKALYKDGLLYRYLLYLLSACYLPANTDVEDSSLVVKKGKNKVFLILDENHCSNRKINTNDKRLQHIKMTRWSKRRHSTPETQKRISLWINKQQSPKGTEAPHMPWTVKVQRSY